jgi:hydroxyacyl-ACP dehydratase HTD2-like protein with hotdog domain
MTAEARRVLARRQYTFTELDLFMFSASTWLTHRIHFDRDYARTEGFEDLVVHGPLQGAHFSDLLTELASKHGGVLADLTYRHHHPIMCGEPVTFEVVLPEARQLEREAGGEALVDVDVQLTGADGTRFATGRGVLRFASRGQALPLLCSRV